MGKEGVRMGKENKSSPSSIYLLTDKLALQHKK